MELADRCEREGPSRELDCRIAFAVTGDIQIGSAGPLNSPRDYMLSEAMAHPGNLRQIAADDDIDMILRFTASLDAAAALLPQGWRLHCLGEQSKSFRIEIMKEGHKVICVYASAEAMARCAAALRALASKEEK